MLARKGRREVAVLREAFQRARISYPRELGRRREPRGSWLIQDSAFNHKVENDNLAPFISCDDGVSSRSKWVEFEAASAV